MTHSWTTAVERCLPFACRCVAACPFDMAPDVHAFALLTENGQHERLSYASIWAD